MQIIDENLLTTLEYAKKKTRTILKKAALNLSKWTA